MGKEFINPNLHVVLIHYPLALLVVGVLIETFAFLGWRRSAFRAAGRWIILLGAVSLGPVMFTGLYAMADVNRAADAPIGSDQRTWAEVRAESPIQGDAWEFMTQHGWSTAFGSAVILLVVVLWLGNSDVWRARLHFIYLLLLIAGLGVIVYGAWFGGELVYRYGVGVERPQGEASEVSTAEEPEGDGAKPGPEFFTPPLQAHVILAGATVSLALVALGLSLRMGAQREVVVTPTPELGDIGMALNPNARAVSPTIGTDGTVRVDEIHRPMVRRFWFLAAILALLSVATGWWTLAQFSDTRDIKALWEMVLDTETGGKRRLAHVILAGGTVALLLLLTLLGRWAATRRLVLMVLSLLLIVAVAAQVWVGSLLMFDSNLGPVTKFNQPEATAEPSSESPTTQPSDTESTQPATAPSTEPTT